MKRSPMPKRSSPLKRGQWRRTPSSAVDPERRANSLKRSKRLRSTPKPTDPASVAAIVERSGGICESRIVCQGAPGCDPQHVRKRSQGRDDDPANLLWICRLCHEWIENEPRTAHAMGVQFSAKWQARGLEFGTGLNQEGGG